MSRVNQNQIPQHLLTEIKEALESVKFGSIEIFVHNKIVTQITVRNIHKTSMEIQNDSISDSINLKIQKSSVEVR